MNDGTSAGHERPPGPVPAKWRALVDALEESRDVVLTTHVSSDGDGIGCELALGRTLARMGKRVSIINPTPTQDRYAFLLREGEIRHHAPELGPTIAGADTIVVLDINRWDRLGEMAEPVRASAARKLCVDHHPASQPFGDVDVIDTKASATGLLIHELLVVLCGEVPRDAVDGLYVALMTDTGGFRFANTSYRAFEVAADLARRGARPDVLFRNVYETSSPARMRLLGHVLATLSYEAGGRLVHFTIESDDFARTGADLEESEGFTDVVRWVEGSEVVVSFLETASGGTKISLRSKGDVLDVGRLANRFGGGGHANASGIVDARGVADARAAVLEAILRALDATPRPGSHRAP